MRRGTRLVCSKCLRTALDLRVSKGQLPRALRIADALLKSFADRGWQTTVQDGLRTLVRVDAATIALSIHELVQDLEVPPKPNLTGRYDFHYKRREILSKPSGHLSISIEEQPRLWRHNQRRTWNESDERPLEQRLNAVLVGMLKLASAATADAVRRDREAREEEERRRKREAALEEQRRLRAALAEERQRVERLREQATRWRESQNLRLFVEQARERGALPEVGLEGQPLAQWIEWALQQADRLDPFAPSPPSILDDADRIEQMGGEQRLRR